jgi:hypothetical protein
MAQSTSSAAELADVATSEELATHMKALWDSDGKVPLRELETWGVNQNLPMPKSSLHDALTGKRVPNEHLLRHFLAAHGVKQESEVQPWLDALDRVRPRSRTRSTAERPLEPAPAHRFFVEADDVTEISRCIDKVQEQVWLLGTTLSMHVPYLRPTLQRIIINGRNVRVLLIKPHGAAMQMSALRAGPQGLSEQEQEEHLANNLASLRNLARFGPHLEVRLIDYLAPYTLYAYDPGLQVGRMIMRLGSFYGRHELRPTFQVERARDDAWFDYFYDQFVSIWNAAEPYDLRGDEAAVGR